MKRHGVVLAGLALVIGLLMALCWRAGTPGEPAPRTPTPPARSQASETVRASVPEAPRPPAPAAAVEERAVQVDEPRAEEQKKVEPPATVERRPDPYADAEVIAEETKEEGGTKRTTRIVKSKKETKYPLVRLEETDGQDKAPAGRRAAVRRKEMVADHIIVQLKEGVTEQALRDLAQAKGTKIRRKLRVPGPGTYLVEIPANDVSALPRLVEEFKQAAKQVAYAEPDYIVHASETVIPDDPQFSQLWGMHNTGQTGGTVDADIDAPEAWSLCTGSRNVKVGVIDTGIDYTHPDLAPNIWTNPGETGVDTQGRDKATNGVDDDGNGYIDDVHGWDFENNDNNPMDDNFHGTHVAGTIGAVGSNGVGVAGVCWQVTLIPLKFLDSSGSGSTSAAQEAIAYATAQGVVATNNSWGGGSFSQGLKDAIDAAGNNGCLFIAAAGNSGLNTDYQPAYPASYECANIIAVAASDASDQLSYFSNFGRQSVDLAAPGTSIWSTLPVELTDEMGSLGLSTSYGALSGTSMATPHVTGAVALAKAFLPTISSLELRQRVLQRTDMVYALANQTTSSGRLNVWKLLDPSWQPSPALVMLASTALSDAEGNLDGNANPGEVIQLRPNLLNMGQHIATGVRVVMSCSHPGVQLLNTDVNFPNLAPVEACQSEQPLRLQLSPTLPDEEFIQVRFTIEFSGEQRVETYEFPVAVAPPFAIFTAPEEKLTVRGLLADPVRNWVYLVSKPILGQADAVLLVVDTEMGKTIRSIRLGDSPYSIGFGGLALSPDGSKLYVSLHSQKKIQVFNVPTMELYGEFALEFKPAAIACCAGNQLFVTDLAGEKPICRLDSLTGARLGSFGYVTYSPDTWLGASHDSRRLHVAWERLWGGVLPRIGCVVTRNERSPVQLLE